MNQIPRSELRRGIWLDGYRETWSSSWHESESTLFASKDFECDDCSKTIERGDLMSQGIRQIYPDAPLSVAGVDRVHLQCTDKDTPLKDHLKRISDITEVPGWAALTPEQKNKWLEAKGQQVTQEALNKKQVFMGVQCMISGDFDNKWKLESTLTEGGATVNKNVIKSLTHLIAGRTGRSDYGQKTGPGSKKFTEAKKIKGIVVLTEEQVHGAVKQFEIDHIPLIERSDIGKPAVAKKAATPKKAMTFSDDVEDEAGKKEKKKEEKPAFTFSDDVEEEEKKEDGNKDKKQQQADADADTETNKKKGTVTKAPANGKRKAAPTRTSSRSKKTDSDMGDTSEESTKPTAKAEAEADADAEEEADSEEAAAKKAKKKETEKKHTSSTLASLSRRELQSMAKKYGLKANGSNGTLIEEILSAINRGQQ